MATKETTQRLRNDRLRKGLCAYCGKKRAKDRKFMCHRCSTRHKERQDEVPAKKTWSQLKHGEEAGWYVCLRYAKRSTDRIEIGPLTEGEAERLLRLVTWKAEEDQANGTFADTTNDPNARNHFLERDATKR